MSPFLVEVGCLITQNADTVDARVGLGVLKKNADSANSGNWRSN